MAKQSNWTLEMDQKLLELYHSVSVNQLAKELGVSKYSLLRRAKKLGLKSKKVAGTCISRPWTERDLSSLKYYLCETDYTYYEIAAKLNRTHRAVENKTRDLGFVKGYKRNIWTPELDECIKMQYKKCTNVAFSDQLDIGPRSIARRKLKLGLKPLSKKEIAYISMGYKKGRQ